MTFWWWLVPVIVIVGVLLLYTITRIVSKAAIRSYFELKTEYKKEEKKDG